jgi:chromosome segregation ATPase
LAHDHHSAALAQLASQIAVVARYGGKHGKNPFEKVKGLISEMISKLEKEAEAEATEKAYCDEEMAKTKAKKDELSSDIATLTAKTDKASAASAQLKEEVTTFQAELAALAKTTAEMDKARADENAVFVETKTDLSAGIAGVGKALEVLRSYYGSSSASLIQNDKFDSLMQQPSLPPPHSASGGAGGSIIGILEQCLADFTKDLSHAEMTEEEAQSEYDKVSQENAIIKQTKDQDVTYKTKEAKGLDKSIAEFTSDKDSLQTELDAVLEYQQKINKQCIATPETYEERKARREAEITGLKEALKILESEGVFLQRPRRLRSLAAH